MLTGIPLILVGSNSEVGMKQEEIREGIAKKLCLWDGLDWEKLPESGYINSKDRDYYRRQANSIFQDLHSQGCVLRVDRELPKFKLVLSASMGENSMVQLGYNCNRQDMLKAGYVAVEPIIEEQND